MARPRPKVLLDFTDRETYITDQVLASDGIWAIFYKGKPINLKSSSMTKKGMIHKYKKVSFSNPGHAINLAKKLNKQYRCTDFTVVHLTEGPVVYEGSEE